MKICRKVQVVTVTSQGFVLLLQTNEVRGGFWQNITGSVEGDESNLSAAEREFVEETGIILSKGEQLIQLPGSNKFTDRWQRKVEEFSFFVCLSGTSLPSVRIDPSEHQGFRWVKWENLTPSDYGFISNYEAFCAAREVLSSSL